MTNRRNFLYNMAALGSVTMAPSLLFSQAKTISAPLNDLITIPDLERMFPSPVMIKSIDLLKFDGEYLLRVTSVNGETGITLCNQRMPHLVSILHGLIIPNMIGKDARKIESLIDEVYVVNSNYKYAGMPFWNCFGHVEIAIFDMLGKITGKPVNQLLGEPLKHEIDIYLSSTTRETTPQQEADFFVRRCNETGAKAVKFKVGGRMSKNADAMPGRSEEIVPLMRNMLGDSITFYVDANGSYDVQNGIRMARFLEEHKVDIFEEPVPFDEYENTKKVTDTIRKMRIAGGEQDTSSYRFGWIAQNYALDVLQPDLYYNGGIIRCLKVAQTAAKYGLTISPHSPKTDPLAAPMLHFVSVLPNLGGFQEWHINYPKHKSWYTPHFKVTNGKVSVPSGPGLGIEYDAAIWEKAFPVTGTL